MHPVVSKVKKFIDDKHLLKDDAKIIVGVSGGADSITLLDILYQLGYECIVAHCNFHLRADESDRDATFVKQVALQYDLAYHIENFDTFGYMQKKHLSLEMAARELRYNWFETIRQHHKADHIAVAHHQDDSVETVLINLIRGTGIKGLTGIAAINDKIIRPLLCLSKTDINTYIRNENLKFVEDSTNKQDDYVRNKIRLHVIPLLQSINPSVIKTIARTSDNLLQTENVYNNHIQEVKNKVFKDNRIDIALLIDQVAPKTILFELLSPYGFNTITINNIYDSIDKQSGKQFFSTHYKLIKDRESFILEHIEQPTADSYTIPANTQEIEHPVKLSFQTLNNTPELRIEKNSNSIYLDTNKLSYPLTIRKWQKGDKFIPFGMKGHKKLSDYFTDKKLSIADKEKIWLLCSNDKIVWIIGKRADNRFRVTNQTTEVLKIELADFNNS